MSGPTNPSRPSRPSKLKSPFELPASTRAAIMLRVTAGGMSTPAIFRELRISRFGLKYGTFRAFVTRLRRRVRMRTVRTELRGRRPDCMSPRRLPTAILAVVRRRTLEGGHSAASTYRALRLAGFGVKENTFCKYVAKIRKTAGIPSGETQSRCHIVANAVASIVVGEFESPGEISACLARAEDVVMTTYAEAGLVEGRD